MPSVRQPAVSSGGATPCGREPLLAVAVGVETLRRLCAAVKHSGDPRSVRRLIREIRSQLARIDSLCEAAQAPDPSRSAGGRSAPRIDSWPEQWLG